MKVDVVARLTHIWKTGVVVTALLATVVACGSSDSSRARNAALVAGTSCVKPGAVTKISKVSVVCAKTTTGKIWYPTMKSYGRSVSCMKPGVVRKKKSVVWVCGVVKSKKLWFATSPLPPAVLQASVVMAPGVVEPAPILESTEVATPSRPVVADNNVLANPTIADEPPVTTPVTIQTIPSAPVTIATVPETTTPAISLTCAEGGSCKVGDTGPGGGTVFYAAVGTFASPGSTCNTACTYLEAAPTGWITASTPARQTNCATAGTSTVDPKCWWSGNTVDRIGTTGTGIGTGYKNTSAMITQLSGGDTAGKAATVARAFQGGGKTDWSLPSKDELNALCKWAFNDTVNAICNTPIKLSLTNGGFEGSSYWSSSENATNGAWYQGFGQGTQIDYSKSYGAFVRPVRAF